MSRRHERGFTLIEMLVVITVIAILAAVVTPVVFRNVGDARQAAARAQLEIFELALDAYRLDTGYYPSTAQGLAALAARAAGAPAASGWRGPYLKRGVPADPWGHAYLYRCPGAVGGFDSYDLLSLGRDGVTGGTGEDADVSLAPPAAGQ